MRLTTTNSPLVDALLGISLLEGRENARRFLEGLSTDELQYIAAYLGAKILDPNPDVSPLNRAELSREIERYEVSRCSARDRADQAHKMILLLEFLSLGRSLRPDQAWSNGGGIA